jgi:hypothetical protein
MKRYEKAAFSKAVGIERDELCTDLAKHLSARLQEAGHFHGCIRELIGTLRGMGHDLWSMDEADDFEVWGPNYEQPTGPGIVITFSAPDEVEVQWTAE